MQGVVWFSAMPGMQWYDEARAGWRADEGAGLSIGFWGKRHDAHKLQWLGIDTGSDGERIAGTADSNANAAIHPFRYRSERPIRALVGYYGANLKASVSIFNPCLNPVFG